MQPSETVLSVMGKGFVSLLDAALLEAQTLMAKVEDDDDRVYLAFQLTTHFLTAGNTMLSLMPDDEKGADDIMDDDSIPSVLTDEPQKSEGRACQNFCVWGIP